MTESAINKTMDRQDLDDPRAAAIVAELNDLIRTLQARGLAASSWYGALDLPLDSFSIERVNRGPDYEALENAADDRLFPWFLYWQIAWVALHAEFLPGQSVLDLGGSSSLFSFYLAHKGCKVVAVDLQKDLVENANRVSQAMGWALDNRIMDMRALAFSQQFDHVTSICVMEHLRPQDRIATISQVRSVLRPGGRFSITFDYRNPARSMRIASPQDVEEQFIQPSGLRVRGNRAFSGDGPNYLLQPFYFRQPFHFWKYKTVSVLKGDFGLREWFRPRLACDYTFGALFLENE